MKRNVTLKDKFKITCRKCGYEKVWLTPDSCEECGENIDAECCVCDNKFIYHDFELIEESTVLEKEKGK